MLVFILFPDVGIILCNLYEQNNHDNFVDYETRTALHVSWNLKCLYHDSSVDRNSFLNGPEWGFYTTCEMHSVLHDAICKAQCHTPNVNEPCLFINWQFNIQHIILKILLGLICSFGPQVDIVGHFKMYSIFWRFLSSVHCTCEIIWYKLSGHKWE